LTITTTQLTTVGLFQSHYGIHNLGSNLLLLSSNFISKCKGNPIPNPRG